MIRRRLDLTALRALLPRVHEQLGQQDRARLDALQPLFEGDRLRLSRVLEALYRGKAAIDAQAALRNFRMAVNRAAAQAGLPLRFVVDTKKQTEPRERWCWWEGQGLDEARADEHSAAETRITDPARTVDPRARVEGLVRYGVVCASADRALGRKLIEALQAHLRISKRHRYDGWAPWDVTLGQYEGDEAARRVGSSVFILVLVSPALLADAHARGLVTRAQGEGRLVVPVRVEHLNHDLHDLWGLEGLEFYPRDGKPYAKATRAGKAAFVEGLFAALDDAVAAWRARAPLTRVDPSARLTDELEYQGFPREFIATKARRGSARLAGEAPTATEAAGEDVDALEFLERWALDPQGTPLCALLGETGIGKTTTCQRLTQRLAEARARDSGHAQAIYLDLRRYRWDGKPHFALTDVLDMILARSYRAGTEPPLPAAGVIELVQRHGALAVCDGLDEVLVHMPPEIGGDFIRELWRILPQRREAAGRPGKLLISCRSHYFRTVWEQNTLLRGDEREGLRAEDYQALILLPFDATQIESYLKLNLPEVDTERALDLIRSVHNLEELAERPYTLSLIGQYLPELERKRARGESVQGVDLYAAMVERWLQRDRGKHQFNTAHKELLMEHLAAALWRAGRRVFTPEEFDDWLDDFLLATPRLQGAYGEVRREVLKEDLRTATFVVREDDPKAPAASAQASGFRFAHTSLQEFFLARHLHRALREGALARLEIDVPSRETLDFLRQLLCARPDERAACEATLGRALATYHARTTEFALALWLEAQARGDALARPERLDLRGARLRAWRFGAPAGRRLDLRRADLRGADLQQAVFERVDLSHAEMNGAHARLAEFHEVTAAGLRCEPAGDAPADFVGSIWRLCRLAASDLRGANLNKAQFIRCPLDGVTLPTGEVPLFAACGGADADPNGLRDGAHARLDTFTGHGGGVWACAWSPDGQHLLSGSDDNTLRVWDASSGRCVLTLEGHRGGVMACAWSPDGQHLLSGSSGNTLRVWDASSGRCVLTLEGHRGGVRACAWSPDGQHLLSGSSDNTLRVWDASSGRCVLTLEGHRGGVRACAFGPDGQHLLSGSSDNTLRVWDASSGRCVLTLEGHRGGVRACAWSPDGQHLLSGSDDTTLRVWDASSGRCVLTLEGHRGWVWACAWSPDGQHLLSGSDDNTLRVWDASSGRCVLTLEGHRGWVWACAWSPDGRHLLSGSDDNTLRVWDASSGRCVLTLEGHRGWVWACAWSPDGQHLLSGSDDNTLRVWDASSGRCVLTLEGHRGGVRACAFGPDGQHLLSGSSDNTLRVWDASSGRCVLTLEGHRLWVSACAWSPDGQHLLSGSSDNTLRVWDASSGRCVLTLEGHRGGVRACAWSPDGQHLLSGSDDTTLRVWDASSGRCVLTLEGHRGGVMACAWSPDGRHLLSGSDDNTLRVWDASSGRCVLTLEGHHGWVWACAWSPDGQHLLSGSDDNTLRVWDASSGRCVLTLEGHRGGVMACAWSPDGQHLLSGSSGNTLRVWDASSGQRRMTIARFNDGAEAVLDDIAGQVRHASAGAWRWLGWLAPDPKTGALTRYPAESFGPLPGAD